MMQGTPEFPTWTNEDLKAWRDRLCWTQEKAVNVLGISRRTYITR